MDLYVYLSVREVFKDYDDEDTLMWSKKGGVYGDWESGANADETYATKISENLQRNSSEISESLQRVYEQ